MDDFDYRTATEQEILTRAELLEGKLLGELGKLSFQATEAVRGKGEVGHAIEAYFGIPPNPIAGPDFPGAGIELKVVPLVSTQRGLRVKERTVVSLIDFHTLVEETWATAHVRAKLRILFVFFEHLRGRPKEEFQIHSVLLWSPVDEVEAQIRRDWEDVRAKVSAGLAHELSEADGRILGPCTKGADSRSLKSQPFSDIKAMSRAFALKPWFTYSLYFEPELRPVDAEELGENANLAVLRLRFAHFVGRNIDEVAAELGVRPSKAKNYAARVVYAAVTASSPLPIDEFKGVGPTVKATRIDEHLHPYEATSFPAFRHLDLVEEDWQDSELLSLIEHMLLVPVYGQTKNTPQGECLIREPTYWEPKRDQLDQIEMEWTMFRDLIAQGKAESLPTAGKTRAIHVRPHGIDSRDRDEIPGGGTVPRKSFWLNRLFVQSILRTRELAPNLSEGLGGAAST